MCCLSWNVSLGEAETVRLLSGRVIKGEVIERGEEHIKIKEGDRVLTIQKKIIDDGTTRQRRYLPQPVQERDRMTIREKLRAIREAERRQTRGKADPTETVDTNQQTPEPKDQSASKDLSQEEPSPDPSEGVIPAPPYANAADQCPLAKMLQDCQLHVCRQKHPTDTSFVIRHMVKGFHSPDGNRNKCNYQQSVPGKPGEVIECYFMPSQRNQFIQSLRRGDSSALSENTFLQKALEDGVCVPNNLSVLIQKRKQSCQDGSCQTN